MQPSSSAPRLLFALFLALLLPRCGGDDGGDSGPTMCGDALCGLHQRCDPGTPPRCICEEEYTGGSCDTCAAGYSLVGEVCKAIPIDCATGNPCGAYGKCVEAGEHDRCECTMDHAGRTCAQCVDGLQDNDGNGTCTAACGHTELTCERWEACDDSSGAVSCGCSPHSTGRHCDECESGYYRLADGPCVKECRGDETCPGSQACKEVEGVDATCTCPLGSTGTDCTSCAEGFAMSNGVCTRSPTPGHLLLGDKDMNWEVLYDFDPQTKAFTSLRSKFPSLLVSDRTKHELWAGESITNGSSFGRYELATNTVSPLSASHAFNNTATYDPSRRAVFWVVPDDLGGLAGTLTRLDVDSGAETSIAHLEIRNYDFMTYDPKNDRLISTDWDSGLVLVSIDPNTGALATLGKPAFETNGTNPRLSVDDAGQIYVLGSIQRKAHEGLRDMLVEVFKRLGLPALASDAPTILTSTYYVDTSKPVVLSATGSSGAEVVAYDSYGGISGGGVPPPTTVQIAVKNPDAVVSLTTFSETWSIQIPADAQFKTLFVYGGGSHKLEIAPGFAGAPGSIVMLGSKLEHDALEALSPAVRAFTSKAIEDRRAPVDAYYDDTDDDPPLWLVRVDPATMGVTLVQRMGDNTAQALTLY